jgi:hypothetical protein
MAIIVRAMRPARGGRAAAYTYTYACAARAALLLRPLPLSVYLAGRFPSFRTEYRVIEVVSLRKSGQLLRNLPRPRGEGRGYNRQRHHLPHSR